MLNALRNFLFFAIYIFIMTSAVLELIFAPAMTLKYYAPSLCRTNDLSLAFFYVVCILVQVFNLLAAICVLTSALLTGYIEKWLAYDTMNLVSVALSLSLLTHRAVTGMDYYNNYAEKDIYKQVARTGDEYCTRKACYTTDVFNWHQSSQCCGWHETADLAGMVDEANTERLPQFCCFSNITRAANHTCTQNAKNRFRQPCIKNRTAFLVFRSVTYISHPASLPYSALKLVATLAYTFAKKHLLIPQTAGIYSYHVPM